MFHVRKTLSEMNVITYLLVVWYN